MTTPSHPTRRDFATLLAASSSGWALATTIGDAGAQEKPPKAGEPQSPTAADHALQLLLSRFPDERLDEAARASLRADLERYAARSRVLASVELANGDEPAFAFAAYRRSDESGK